MKSSHRSVVLLLLGLVVGCAACLLFSSLGYQRGYRAALDHQKAHLFITIDALEQVHDGNVRQCRWGHTAQRGSLFPVGE